MYSSSSEVVNCGLGPSGGFGTPACAPSSSVSDDVVDEDEDPEEPEVSEDEDPEEPEVSVELALDASWGAPFSNAGRTLASKRWMEV